MRKILYSEYILLVHTVMTYLFSSSLSLVWYLNYFSIFTAAVIFIELYMIKGWRPGREWIVLFVPLFLLAGIGLIAVLLDPITKPYGIKIGYAYILAYMYFSVVLATKRIWFVVWGLFLSLAYLAISQGFGASDLALHEGIRAKLVIGSDAKTDRLNANVYGLICLFCSAFASFQAFEAKRLYRSLVVRVLIYIVSAIIVLVSSQQIVIVTGSRKGMIFMCYWLVVAGVMAMRGRISIGRLFASLIVSTLLLVAGLVVLYLSPFFWRFEEMFYSLTGQATNEMSVVARTEFYKVGFDMWLSSPIYGDFCRFWKTFGTYSHSNPIELLVNHGIIGFFLYYVYYLNTFKKIILPCLRSRIPVICSTAIFLGAFFLMFFLWEIAAVNYYSRYSFPVIGVLLGMSVVNLMRLREFGNGRAPYQRF